MANRHDQNPDIVYHQLNDQELLKYIRDGHHQAIEQVYYHHRDAVLKFAWIMTGDHDAATKTVKRVFSELFEEIENISEQRLDLSIMTRTRNILKQELDNVSAPNANLDLSDDTLAGEGYWTGPSSEIELPSEAEELLRNVMNLPKRERELVSLFFLHTCDNDDLQVITGETEETVRSRLENGLRRLRLQMIEDPALKQRRQEQCDRASEPQFLRYLDEASDANDGDAPPTFHSHLDSCDICRDVLSDVETMYETVEQIQRLSLPPFPKGDESDLLSEARTAAKRIANETPDKPDLDPDVRQVLTLLPWAFILLAAVILLPMLTQSEDPKPEISTTGTQIQVGSHENRTDVYLNTDGKPIGVLKLRLIDRKGIVQSIKWGASIDRNNVKRESLGSSSNNFQMRKQLTILFTQTIQNDQIHLLTFSLSGTGAKKDDVILEVQEAYDQEGHPLDVQLSTKTEQKSN